MESAAFRASSLCCAHCGLPVSAAEFPLPSADGSSESEVIFCCHACRLVAAIIGRQENGEQSWNLLRLGLGSLLAMNIMMMSLLLYFGSVEAHTVPLFRLILLGLAVPALAILIPPFLTGAARELAARKLSLDALIACGSLSAFGLSAVNVVRGSGEIYFDTATMLPVLVTVGKIIEASAKSRAADLLHSLEALLPERALRMTPSGGEEVGIELLQPGDLVQVRPGERVAVDGNILEGESSINEAAFSGEFLPRHCHPGDRVIAGTVNGTGALLVQAERTGKELLLHGIIDLIQEAWRNPSRAERIAQRAALLFIPVVLVVAAFSFAFWCTVGEPERGLLCVLSVLVVACPCTMGIATPLATSLAIARAAKAGVVVRGGSVMEGIARTDTIFFDKTGTITTGSPVVREVQLIDPLLDQDELLGRLAALESASEHALGRAVLAKAKELGIEPGSFSEIRIAPGRGISGTVSWRGVKKEVTAGTETFVSREGAALPAIEKSCTAIDVGWDGKLRGRLLLTDSVRPDARRCVEELKEDGITSVLLSGDRHSAAVSAAWKVGIEEVRAPRTPEQKLAAITAAVQDGRAVAMVGDGINDAPALAAAQTGIALGAGMELAKQAGNVVLLSGDLRQIPWLISLSKKTAAIIRGNFAWSFSYNAVALAAAGAGLLHPLLAALAMVASSLTVLGNSLRIVTFPDVTTVRRDAPEDE